MLNAFLVGQAITWIVNQPAPPDWTVLRESAHRAATGSPLYVWSDWYHYRWSPVMAYVLIPLTSIGVLGWRVLQVAAVATLPNRWLAVMTAISWPFWFDVETGNTLIFTFTLAVWALRGSRLAAIGYLVLFAVAPRPLMIPLAVWLVWREPSLRVPATVVAGSSIGLAALTGQLFEWLPALLNAAGDMQHQLNFGPSRLLGIGWIVVGAPLAVLFLRRGWVGLASLAASPYWLPYYFLMAFLDLPWARRLRRPGAASSIRPSQ